MLTPSGFDKFIMLLDADRDAAGAKFEALRQRLIKLFEWRGCENPEDLTDIVFDRVMNKISDGEEIQNVNAYSASIAQFIVKEELRRRFKYQAIDDATATAAEFAAAPGAVADEKGEKRFECLERCLSELAADDHRLVIAYYETDKRTMIDARRALADSMEISLNTLRIRVCRLKTKLEACTLLCCREEQI